MKKVLYISVKVVPYRTKFFNEWSKSCDLTVAYETRDCGVRNREWSDSEEVKHKTVFFSDGNDKFSAYIKMFKLLLKDWDAIIIGCWNQRMEIAAMLFMRVMHIPFVLNLDGESFFEGNSWKARLKRWFAKGGNSYLIAGEKSRENLLKVVGKKKRVIPYYFSSLKDEEICIAGAERRRREDFVLVVGQYRHCKGMEVVLHVALRDKSIKYKFVGMGKLQKQFLEEHGVQDLSNIEFIPFLQKADLEEEYKKCSLFVLPSRQECWGLVINEAAAFGTPIVSTWGSGAAVEFLRDDYPCYLAKPGDEESLFNAIRLCLSERDDTYNRFLIEKSKKYTIEQMVRSHAALFEVV